MCIHSWISRIAGAMLVVGMLFGSVAASGAPSGSSPPDPVAIREAAEALARYDRLLQLQDAAGLAGMFMPQGRLGHVGEAPVVGRDRIEAFLVSLADYKVLSNEMTLLSSSSAGSQVSQAGTYVQEVRPPNSQALTVRGWFRFTWQRQPDGRWLIQDAKTSSTPFPEDR
ncbi:MAG: DUF4440 domain-containing protein [Burkholderiales bacterium]|nr:MAG: DUF4440 domain-containing protein [Burkholderiales bacterium]